MALPFLNAILPEINDYSCKATHMYKLWKCVRDRNDLYRKSQESKLLEKQDNNKELKIVFVFFPIDKWTQNTGHILIFFAPI